MYLGPVGDPFGPCHARAVSAAVKRAVRLDAVPDHLDAAILAIGREGMYRALEAIESVRVSTGHTYLKGLVVVIAADFTLGHSSTPFRRFSFVDHARSRRIAICPQTGHDVGIHVFAVAIRESPVGSLYLEPELLVEGYGGRIICVYAEIQSRKVQPVVCEVEASLHQHGANATTLPTIPHSYPEVS